MPRTTGDLTWNESTNRWEPTGGNPIPPYVPAGDVATLDARRSMRAELERQGLPIPAHLVDAEPAEEPGGQHRLSSREADGFSGASPDATPLSTAHLQLDELGSGDLGTELDDIPPVDRLGELEKRPAHDTDRPPPPRKRR